MTMRAYLIGCGLVALLASFSLAAQNASRQIEELVLANHTGKRRRSRCLRPRQRAR